MYKIKHCLIARELLARLAVLAATADLLSIYLEPVLPGYEVAAKIEASQPRFAGMGREEIDYFLTNGERVHHRGGYHANGARADPPRREYVGRTHDLAAGPRDCAPPAVEVDPDLAHARKRQRLVTNAREHEIGSLELGVPGWVDLAGLVDLIEHPLDSLDAILANEPQRTAKKSQLPRFVGPIGRRGAGLLEERDLTLVDALQGLAGSLCELAGRQNRSHVSSWLLLELAQLFVGERRLQHAAPARDLDVLHPVALELAHRILRDVRGREVPRIPQQHARNVERDVAIADNRRRLSLAQLVRHVEVLELRLAVVPANKLARRKHTGELLTGYAEPALALGAVCEQHSVEVRRQILQTHILADSAIAKKLEIGARGDLSEPLLAVLDLGVVGRNAEPRQTERHRELLEHRHLECRHALNRAHRRVKCSRSRSNKTETRHYAADDEFRGQGVLGKWISAGRPVPLVHEVCL